MSSVKKSEQQRAIEELGAMARGDDPVLPADARDEPVWRCPHCGCLNADHEVFCYRCGRQGDDEEDDYDPTQEGGGGPCERCGQMQEPWRFSRLCQGCIWDEADAL